MYPTIKIPTCQTPFTKPSHTNQPSNTATMPQPSPSPQETQPFSQPSSAATMAHPSPSDHRKLSLSSQPSSAALMAHPTPGNPLNPPALINPHFRQSPHTPTTTSRPEPNSRGDAIHHKKERPAAHPARKERSPNFHQLTIIHNHLRSAYNPIRSHQI